MRCRSRADTHSYTHRCSGPGGGDCLLCPRRGDRDHEQYGGSGDEAHCGADSREVAEYEFLDRSIPIPDIRSDVPIHEMLSAGGQRAATDRGEGDPASAACDFRANCGGAAGGAELSSRVRCRRLLDAAYAGESRHLPCNTVAPHAKFTRLIRAQRTSMASGSDGRLRTPLRRGHACRGVRATPITAARRASCRRGCSRRSWP
jgi:hypothetical protein